MYFFFPILNAFLGLNFVLIAQYYCVLFLFNLKCPMCLYFLFLLRIIIIIASIKTIEVVARLDISRFSEFTPPYSFCELCDQSPVYVQKQGKLKAAA